MTSATAGSNARLSFFVGVNTGLVSDGQPDARYVEFYRKRSSQALHCAIIGNVVIPGGYGSNRSTPLIDRNPIWAKVADAIRGAGSLPGIQLATTWPGYEGTRKFVSSGGAEVIEQARHLTRSLGLAGSDRIVASLAAATAIAVEHGFGHVQVHAAHGYLLNLLVDERINSGARRVREQLGEWAERLRARGVETSVRISMRTGESSFDHVGTEAFQDAMAALPFDFVDLSSGFYNIDKRLIYPSRPEIVESRLREGTSIALRHPNRRFIVSGRIAGKGAGLPPNAHLGICRDLIANPKALTDLTNGCRNYGKCHYYSRGDDHVTCPAWVETGGDLEISAHPPSDRLH